MFLFDEEFIPRWINTHNSNTKINNDTNDFQTREWISSDWSRLMNNSSDVKSLYWSHLCVCVMVRTGQWGETTLRLFAFGGLWTLTCCEIWCTSGQGKVHLFFMVHRILSDISFHNKVLDEVFDQTFSGHTSRPPPHNDAQIRCEICHFFSS